MRNAAHKPKCPLCEGDSIESFEVDSYQLSDCLDCSHRFLSISDGEKHVGEVYGDGYFYEGGAGYSDYTKEASMLEARGGYYSEIVKRHIKSPGTMLDVGAAAGFVLKGFLNDGWKGVGLEPNLSMCEYGRNNLGLEIFEGSLETFESEKSYDLVSMIQVAAHFYDPKKVFEKAKLILKPGGILLVETWNRRSKMARILGKKWHEYSPPSVVNWFSQDGLNEFLECLDLEMIETGRPSKKISGDHVRSILEYKIGRNPLLRLIPKRINFPYPSEDLFYSLFRKRNEE